MLSRHCPATPDIECTQFGSLNLNCLSIRIIDKVRLCYCFISQLYLDHNSLITLNGIQQFTNLQVLTNFNELYKIKNRFFIKQISVIGNPLQSDQRAKYEYVKSHLFSNMQSYNSIDARSNPEQYANKRIKLKNRQYSILSQCGSSQNDKTERYKQDPLESLLTRRPGETIKNLALLAATESKFKNIGRAQEYKQQKLGNISTAVNKSSSSPYFYSGSKQRPVDDQAHQQSYRKTAYNRIKVQPFKSVEQFDEHQDEGYEAKRGQMSQQSEIRADRHKQFSVSLFQQRSSEGRLSNIQLNQKQIASKIPKYRNLAMEFLEQQKMDIAQAFHIRYVKQKIFEALALQTEQSKQTQSELKRKAWGAIKIYNALVRMQGS